MVSSVYLVFIVLTFKEIDLNFVFIPNNKTNIRIKHKHLHVDSLCKTIGHFRIKQFNNSSTFIYFSVQGSRFWEREVVYLFLSRKLMTSVAPKNDQRFHSSYHLSKNIRSPSFRYTVGTQIPHGTALTLRWNSPQMTKELKDWTYFIPGISAQANTKTGTPEITLVSVN